MPATNAAPVNRLAIAAHPIPEIQVHEIHRILLRFFLALRLFRQHADRWHRRETRAKRGLAFQFPETFPLAATAASRAFYWLQEQDTARARRFAGAVYHAYFGAGRDISRAEELRRIAGECGIDGDRLLEAADEPGIRDLFRQNNDAALAKGVFGSPYFIVDGEPFWGADRLDQVDQWLETGGW